MIAGTISVLYPSINPYVEGWLVFSLVVSVITHLIGPFMLKEVMISELGKERIAAIRKELGGAILFTILSGVLLLWYQDVHHFFIAFGVINNSLTYKYTGILEEYLPEDSDV